MDSPAGSVEALLPRYRSHKEVWALKIDGISPVDSSGRATLYPAEKGYAPFQVDARYMEKHEPKVGGYFVQYRDGYKSWSPAGEFEGGYTLIDGARGETMSDAELARALRDLPGDRVTEEYMRSRIRDVAYNRVAPTLTHCTIYLDNGYYVTGESACVDPANYRQGAGEKLAWDAAFRKMWPLFGFLLAETRYRRKAI